MLFTLHEKKCFNESYLVKVNIILEIYLINEGFFKKLNKITKVFKF